MNTFLPYENFSQSAECLDYRRLGKQRVEAKQILNILLGRTTSNAWKNHPCVKMWRGYEVALQIYYNEMLLEWINRGYKNTMQYERIEYQNYIKPSWLGKKKFHKAMRSNLLRKDYKYYSKFGWTEPTDLPYIWGNK